MAPTRRGPAAGDGPGPEITTPASTTIESHDTAPSDVAADPWSAHCLNLNRDPEVAAEDLKAAVGGRAAAYRWAVALIAEVGR